MKISRRDFLKMGAVSSAAFLVSGVRPVLSLDFFQTVDDPYKDYPYTGWEDLYRDQWVWDKVARSTHSANCTGSCSWMVYVKDGIAIREEQAADYPEISPDLSDYNPRGCQKGGHISNISTAASELNIR